MGDYERGVADAAQAIVERIADRARRAARMAEQKADAGLRLEEILWSGECLGYQEILADLLQEWCGNIPNAQKAAAFYRAQASDYRLHILHAQSVSNAFVPAVQQARPPEQNDVMVEPEMRKSIDENLGIPWMVEQSEERLESELPVQEELPVSQEVEVPATNDPFLDLVKKLGLRYDND